jgi:shikimate 5-dehydrogenase
METYLVYLSSEQYVPIANNFAGQSDSEPYNGLRQPLLNEISKTFATVRRTTVVPCIFHVVKEIDSSGSMTAGNKSVYMNLTHHGLRLVPEFATLDLSLSDDDILALMQVKGSTRLVAHCFSSDERYLNWDHNYWISAYERARRLGFDAVRLCWPAKCLADNFAIQQFRSKVALLGASTLPLVAYNTGRLGKTSCCFNPTLTPVTHANVTPNELQLENPYCTAAEATRALYASFVFEPMRFYIVGASTGYSLSPAMHMAAYRACGMPHTYKVHEIPSLNEFRALVEDPHFGGCSISLPFKLEVINLAKSISSHAKAIGAINTLVPVRYLRDDGSIPSDLEMFKERNRAGPVKALYGENSDWIGIRSCIRRGLSPANAVGPRTTALIIGAGGMARAAVYACLKLGVRNIFIFNRTLAHAETIAEHFRNLVDSNTSGKTRPRVLPASIDAGTHIQVLASREEPWPESFRQPTIVVSCIPTHRLGENPSPNFTLPHQWLDSPTGGVVLEVRHSF